MGDEMTLSETQQTALSNFLTSLGAGWVKGTSVLCANGRAFVGIEKGTYSGRSFKGKRMWIAWNDARARWVRQRFESEQQGYVDAS